MNLLRSARLCAHARSALLTAVPAMPCFPSTSSHLRRPTLPLHCLQDYYCRGRHAHKMRLDLESAL